VSASINRLRHLAALGDAASAAEVIRYRERSGEAWCQRPYPETILPPMTSRELTRQEADELARWAVRHIRQSGALTEDEVARLECCVFFRGPQRNTCIVRLGGMALGAAFARDCGVRWESSLLSTTKIPSSHCATSYPGWAGFDPPRSPFRRVAAHHRRCATPNQPDTCATIGHHP
jgi:hypothetical protein